MFDIGRWIVVVIVLLGSTPAFALNLIALGPIEHPLRVGSDFTLDLIMDFDEVTVGGGVGVAFDPLLTFLSFDFDPSFTANFGLSGPAPGETVAPHEIAFGWFLEPEFGETGLHIVGQLTFRANGLGPAEIVMTSLSFAAPGSFFGPADPFNPMVIQFGTADINIVPEPQTALLLGLGLIGLAWGARVRSPSESDIGTGLGRT